MIAWNALPMAAMSAAAKGGSPFPGGGFFCVHSMNRPMAAGTGTFLSGAQSEQ